MAIVDISNLPKPVAVALDWHLLPGATSERKELDSLAKRSGAKFGCVITEDEAVLTMVGFSSDKKDGVNCGAAWLARASAGEPLLLVEPLADGRLWLCAVRASLPVQGMDVIIDSAQLHERIREFLSDGGEAKLCSTLENLDQVYPNVVPQSYAELVSNVKAERVRRISGINPAITTAAVLALVAFGAWYGFDQYMAKMRLQEAQTKLAQMSEQQKQQEALRIAAAKQAHLEAGQAKIVQVVLSKPSVTAIMKAYMDMLSSKELTLAGYTLVSYDCSQLSCDLTWNRTEGGTIVRFLEAAEGRGYKVVFASGNEAVSTHSIQVEPRVSTIEDLSEDVPFRAALESKLQRAGASGLKYELKNSVSLDSLMGPPAAVDPAAPAPAAMDPLPYWVGDLVVKGSAFFQLRELPDYIAHPGISVKNLRGDLKTNEWKLELNYATR